MKEATGEVSMTVITIVLLVAVLGIGMFLFGSKDSVGRKWIENTFNNITNKGDNAWTTWDNKQITKVGDNNERFSWWNIYDICTNNIFISLYCFCSSSF